MDFVIESIIQQIESNVPECVDLSTVLDWFDFEPIAAQHPDLERIGLMHMFGTSFLIHEQDLYCNSAKDSSSQAYQMEPLLEILVKISSETPSNVSGRFNIALRDFSFSSVHSLPLIPQLHETTLNLADVQLPHDLPFHPDNYKCPANLPKFVNFGEPLSVKYPLNEKWQSLSLPTNSNLQYTSFLTSENDLLELKHSYLHEGYCPYKDGHTRWSGSDISLAKHIPNYRHSTMMSWVNERFGLSGGFPLFYQNRNLFSPHVSTFFKDWSDNFFEWADKFHHRSQKLFWIGGYTQMTRLRVVCDMHNIVESKPSLKDYIDIDNWFVSDSCIDDAQVLEKLHGCKANKICKKSVFDIRTYDLMLSNSKYQYDIGGWGPFAIRLRDMMATGAIVLTDSLNDQFEQIFDGAARRQGWFKVVEYGKAQSIVDAVLEIENCPKKKLEWMIKAYIMQTWTIRCMDENKLQGAYMDVIVRTLVEKVTRIKSNFFKSSTQTANNSTNESVKVASDSKHDSKMFDPASLGWKKISSKGMQIGNAIDCLTPAELSFRSHQTSIKDNLNQNLEDFIPEIDLLLNQKNHTSQHQILSHCDAIVDEEDSKILGENYFSVKLESFAPLMPTISKEDMLEFIRRRVKYLNTYTFFDSPLRVIKKKHLKNPENMFSSDTHITSFLESFLQISLKTLEVKNIIFRDFVNLMKDSPVGVKLHRKLASSLNSKDKQLSFESVIDAYLSSSTKKNVHRTVNMNLKITDMVVVPSQLNHHHFILTSHVFEWLRHENLKSDTAMTSFLFYTIKITIICAILLSTVILLYRDSLNNDQSSSPKKNNKVIPIQQNTRTLIHECSVEYKNIFDLSPNEKKRTHVDGSINSLSTSVERNEGSFQSGTETYSPWFSSFRHRVPPTSCFDEPLVEASFASPTSKYVRSFYYTDNSQNLNLFEFEKKKII